MFRFLSVSHPVFRADHWNQWKLVLLLLLWHPRIQLNQRLHQRCNLGRRLESPRFQFRLRFRLQWPQRRLLRLRFHRSPMYQ
ncbi:hypothetical protein FPQ18DRAFT_318295 [Pyronema domesticum]|nr:hypothetical protein FPQ18DRAFT_318295 [Pyronema domesticum]